MIRTTAEWERGDNGQRAWANELAKWGWAVLPAYALDATVPETKAPILIVHKGLLVTPDVLSFHSARGKTTWFEVKAKARPTWRRLPPGPRWEHGFDYSLLREYQAVEQASGFSVYVVVHEAESPALDNEKNPCETQNCELVGPGRWLYVSLSNIVRCGDHRPMWPQKNGNSEDRGRRGEGGMLWGRGIMRFWEPANIRASKVFSRALPAGVRQPFLPGIS